MKIEVLEQANKIKAGLTLLLNIIQAVETAIGLSVEQKSQIKEHIQQHQDDLNRQLEDL